ncbi:Axonemal dynein light chain [Cinara cedri]|uniref:Axonemal dynein light chain n=1 Tax=Cinara cedri TaxID=506608 RepID=A0A5E4NDR4_9HEMI|nr:Axonemal dynein light chain [Cinara cedri]
MSMLSAKQKVSLFGSGDGRQFTCDDVWNLIVEPKQWKENDIDWKQNISKKPASKTDLKKLSNKLDAYLLQFDAKEVGICPIKQELFSQCFNEIIRQETLNCAERGYMLIMIRDEIKMNIESYKMLYESRTAYGIRKTLLATKILKLENQVLETDLTKTENTAVEFEQEMAEKYEMEVQNHTKMINALKKKSQMFKGSSYWGDGRNLVLTPLNLI